jgi:hypothetical protein
MDHSRKGSHNLLKEDGKESTDKFLQVLTLPEQRDILARFQA